MLSRLVYGYCDIWIVRFLISINYFCIAKTCICDNICFLFLHWPMFILLFAERCLPNQCAPQHRGSQRAMQRVAPLSQHLLGPHVARPAAIEVRNQKIMFHLFFTFIWSDSFHYDSCNNNITAFKSIYEMLEPQFFCKGFCFCIFCRLH